MCVQNGFTFSSCREAAPKRALPFMNLRIMYFLALIVFILISSILALEEYSRYSRDSRRQISKNCIEAVRSTCGADSKYACSTYRCLKPCIRENMEVLKAAGCTRDERTFPESWGPPPERQTKDLRPLPGGYGQGSGTLARWIKDKMRQDAAIRSQRGPYL